jgi:hypothetical protein
MCHYVKDAFAEKNAETYLKVGRQNFADLNLHISLCRSAFRSALPNADLIFKDWVVKPVVILLKTESNDTL